MLSLYSGGQQYPIQYDDYYIRQLASGLDEVVFNVSIWDELYPLMVEEASIRDRDQQWYLIKQIDQGSDAAKIVAKLDLDAWKAQMFVGYSNGSATLAATITGVLPAGWSLVDNTGLTIRRTIEGDYTPMGILDACRDTYGVYFRFDNVAQTVTAVIPGAAQPLGAFATRDLNLRENNYKGKSNDFVTRLYAYGADGLSFASINDGKPYVDDNTYSSKVVCTVWKDDRYTVAENLLADAKSRLAALAVPTRSYDCDVVDLRATNPEMYGFLNFEIFSVAALIDDAKGISINYQVVERWDHPYYPEKNKVIFSSSPAKIQSQVTHITQQIENPNSAFQQQQQAAIGNATNWITGNNGGYVVFQRNAEGQPYEILIMDQPTVDTATKVWRWNNGGLGYSSTGYNGPYTTAITQDGAIVANFLTTGTLNCALLNVINLVAQGVQLTGNFRTLNGNYMMEMWAAVLALFDGNNMRTRIYTTGTENSIGNVQVFSGSVTESGGMQTSSRMSQLQPSYIECGADQNGNCDGIIRAGTVNADAGIHADAEITASKNIITSQAVCFNAVRPRDGQNTLLTNWKRGNELTANDWVLVGGAVAPYSEFET